MDFFKNKPLILIIIVAGIILAAGAYMVLGRGSGQTSETPGEETQNAKTVTPEEIGLELELSSDQQNVIIRITKLDGIQSIDYEFSYDAEEIVEGEQITTLKGVLSTIEVKGESEIEREVYLGTCSGSKCRPDIVVGDINVVLEINYTNGEVGVVESTLPFVSEE